MAFSCCQPARREHGAACPRGPGSSGGPAVVSLGSNCPTNLARLEPQRRTEWPLQWRGRERRQRLHGNTAKWSEWSAEVTQAPRVNITGVFFSFFFPKIKLLTRRVQRRPIIFHENGNSRAGQIASWVVLSWIQEKHFCLKDSELVPKSGLSCLLTTQEQTSAARI